MALRSLGKTILACFAEHGPMTARVLCERADLDRVAVSKAIQRLMACKALCIVSLGESLGKTGSTGYTYALPCQAVREVDAETVDAIQAAVTDRRARWHTSADESSQRFSKAKDPLPVLRIAPPGFVEQARANRTALEVCWATTRRDL